MNFDDLIDDEFKQIQKPKMQKTSSDWDEPE